MRITACPELSASQMGGSKYYRNAQKPPGTPVQRKRGHYVHFTNGGAEKGKSALPQFRAQGGRAVRQSPAPQTHLSKEGLFGPDREHLLQGLVPRTPLS